MILNVRKDWIAEILQVLWEALALSQTVTDDARRSLVTVKGPKNPGECNWDGRESNSILIPVIQLMIQLMMMMMMVF